MAERLDRRQTGQPGFVSYTAYRGTPLETAARTFMLTRANLPRQARYWGFGSGALIDDDDWEAVWPATAKPVENALQLAPGKGLAQLDSPPNLNFTTDQLDLLVLGLRDPAPGLQVAVQRRMRGQERWHPLVAPLAVASMQRLHAGYLLPLPRIRGQIQQLRLVFSSRNETDHSPKPLMPLTIDQIVLYPAPVPAPAADSP
jgi:hypothetical protein